MREQIDYTQEEQSEELKPVESDYLHDWIFHYNPYTKNWVAIPRDYYTQYWNGYDGKNVLKAKHLNVLIDLLHKAKGDVDIIHDITRTSDLI